MESSELQLLTQLILDIKHDVSAIKEQQDEHQQILIKNSVVLEEHARRSTASENRMELQEEKLEKFIEEMKPVQEHVQVVSGLTKAGSFALKAIAIIASVATAVIKLIKVLR